MARTITGVHNMDIPRWLFGYTLALGVFGIGMGLWSVFAPMGMLNVVDLTLEGTGRPLIIGLFAARNAAFGFLFLIALFGFRTREVLATVFVSRLMLDLMDTVAIIVGGQFDVLRAIEQVVFFIIPVSMAIAVLVRQRRNGAL